MSEQSLISVVGEFVYPHLNKPDVRFNEAGEYKVTLKVPSAKAKEMMNSIDKAIESSIADAEKESGKKVKTAPRPYTIEGDNVFFKFKMKATGVNRKTKENFSQKPVVLDSQKNPMPSTVSIWGGSKGKIAYQMRTYYVPALGAGVTMQLKAVQVIELVEGGSKQLDLFDKEDGYVSQVKEDVPKTTEVQTSTDF
jgi:hypothetical protein|tara:strand:- start:375 stop:959 length:585 start_codon:yes stop_codon:yes gene_type:complete